MSKIQEYVIVKDVTLNWAKLDKPVNPFGTEVWEVQLEVDTAEKAKELETYGLKVKQVDDKYVTNVKRKAKKADGSDNAKVAVFDSALAEIDSSKIGNGSSGNVKLYRFSWEFQGRKGVSNSLTAIQVTNLVEYTGGGGAAAGFDVTIPEAAAEEAAEPTDDTTW